MLQLESGHFSLYLAVLTACCMARLLRDLVLQARHKHIKTYETGECRLNSDEPR